MNMEFYEGTISRSFCLRKKISLPLWAMAICPAFSDRQYLAFYSVFAFQQPYFLTIIRDELSFKRSAHFINGVTGHFPGTTNRINYKYI